MAARINLHLRGETPEKWQESHERVVGCHQPPSILNFAFENTAIQTCAAFLGIGRCRIQLRLNQRRDERERIDLPVRMRHGDPNRESGVLENANVLHIVLMEELDSTPGP
jgi:hypothetical protein